MNNKDPGEGKRYYMLKDGIIIMITKINIKMVIKKKKLDKFKFYKLDNDLVRERKEYIFNKNDKTY